MHRQGSDGPEMPELGCTVSNMLNKAAQSILPLGTCTNASGRSIQLLSAQ